VGGEGREEGEGGKREGRKMTLDIMASYR